MIFKDRVEAGKKLAELIVKKKLKNAIVVSLLRGGLIVGNEVAHRLKIKNLLLAVAKIPSPIQPELGIGAICFDSIYLEPRIINSLKIEKPVIRKQIHIAKKKNDIYQKKFLLKKSYLKLKNKIVIIVDDGVATGSTIKSALLFIKSLKPKKIILAIPVAPDDFKLDEFEKIIIHYDKNFSSVSQFYQHFPQIEDKDVFKILNIRS